MGDVSSFWKEGDFSLRFTSFEMTGKNKGHFAAKRKNLIVIKSKRHPLPSPESKTQHT
jgi:hypothetical protein